MKIKLAAYLKRGDIGFARIDAMKSNCRLIKGHDSREENREDRDISAITGNEAA